MSKRQRMTWAALDRKAAAPPSIPGYGVEDQDHPAHTQDDPDEDDYNIGGPSEFGEDVHTGPYGDSGSPALPGYGVEDQDHPAHSGQKGRQANLMDLVRRKSAKALVLAKATLMSGGRTASWDQIEDQAFGYMTMDDGALDASLGRLGGDFLGMEDELMDMFPEEDMDTDVDMDGPMGMFDDDDGDMDGPMGMFDDDDDDDMDEGMMSRLRAMETELMGMRAAASQNDPDGETLGTNGKSEDEEKKEEAAAKSANHPVLAMFDAFDSDGDGFVTSEDWTGPRAMFASLDTDGDGIIARHEVQAGCEKLPEGKMRDNCESGPPGDKKAKKSDDDDDDDFDFDDKEAKKAKKSDDDEDIELDDEGSDKEASGAEFFTTGYDPMGLADGTSLTAADKAAFNTVFGSDDEDGDDEDGDEDDSDKAASLASLLKPQGRKASTGVKSVGHVSKTASAGGEMAALSNLWSSDPDVSDSFR